jgi:hypothetical protein
MLDTNKALIESRDAQLIKCLEDVEDRLSDFLRKPGNRGKTVLMDGVGRLSAEPEQAIKILREAFKQVVDPVLLDNFDGTWMAFLLWNDFVKEVQILYNYSKYSEFEKNKEYDFVSGFIGSKEFASAQFTEPMTEVIFTEKSPEKHVMVFSWGCCPDEEALSRISNVPSNIRPLLISFDELGGKWDSDLHEILKFVKSAASTSDDQKSRSKDFAELGRMISQLSKNMLADPESRVKEIIKNATSMISLKFALTNHEIDGDALCRTLIWNRLFDREWKFLYYIPAKFLAGSAVSGIVCAFKEILLPRDYIVLTQIVNRIFSLFHFGSFGQQLNLFALRSATAAIMARNKSHIHGSHIEHGLRNKMDDFTGVIEQRLMRDGPFYRSLREKLGILDDSNAQDALVTRIQFIKTLSDELEDKTFTEQVELLDNKRRRLGNLEDISEWLDQCLEQLSNQQEYL